MASIQRDGWGELSQLFAGIAAGGDRLWGGRGLWESTAEAARALWHRGADQRRANDH